MQALTSPGSLLTILGAVLTVVGSIAYATDSPNISLAGVFYGIPLLLGGLALKSSELAPAARLSQPDAFRSLREQPASEPLSALLKDVTRWRYGQKAHLESSLQALKLWDDEQPPELLSVGELESHGGYGLVLRFRCPGVPFERWQAKQERLGRFFGPGLVAELDQHAAAELDLTLLPMSPAIASLESDQA
ncbi:DUF2854 domain-containing protein [Synechococcus sp. Tobar12-5m-g]|uniref:DUF2854 domain-containing protein n=1 Tax=unclassified Synechococcus TaxID=2626047 RepID=UPI0020CC67DE|nr:MULTISPECIES: DUF2854 domain-containing protein [unclassified Synechococcus]MCP9771829.1 DUF2854 domain-containing protein [Synechococcus sp. Tobar12-5m-g]MCP9872771.1 DUF2854 domain-containing protein [Synechococcus sp. Cruz CV-v-12]